MRIELFDIPATRRSEGIAKARIAIKAKDTIGERLIAFRFHENSALYHLRDGAGPHCDDRLARNHCFQKDDAEAFLDTGQAKHMGAPIFLCQPREWQIAEPVHHPFEAQFRAEPSQSFVPRPVADYSNFELWDRFAQLRGSTEQNVETLSGIKTAHRKYGELVTIRPSRNGME